MNFIKIFTILIVLVNYVFSDTVDYTTPNPKTISLGGSNMCIHKNPTVKSLELFDDQYNASLESFKSSLYMYGKENKTCINSIFLRKPTINMLSNDLYNKLKRDESYFINIRKDKIEIISKDSSGLLHGLTTLQYFIIKNQGSINLGQIIDYPIIKERILHIPLYDYGNNFNTIKEIITRARFGHYNKIIFLLFVGFEEENSFIRGYSFDVLNEISTFARENGLEVIPEIKLLSHQFKFFRDSHPELLYNKQTYNPKSEGLYEKYIYKIIDKVVAHMGVAKLHVGHDEVLGWSYKHYYKGKRKLNLFDKQLPAELFLFDVKIIFSYLNKINIEMWMWGDMLLNPKEFQSMKLVTGLNGFNGYDKIRNEIPKSIVICDWHYNGDQKEFLTSLAFISNGHQTYGATWKNENTVSNFTHFMYDINGTGMIATTWYHWNDKKNQIIKIINNSAEVFWNGK